MNTGRTLAALAAIGAGGFLIWLGINSGDLHTPRSRTMNRTAARAGEIIPGGAKWQGRPGQGISRGRKETDTDIMKVGTTGGQDDVSGTGSETSRGRTHRPPVKPWLPLAFAEIPGEMRNDDRHAGDLMEVQDRFIVAIGGEAADPSTPEYKEKWLNAQRQADLELRARIGAQAFAARQRAARQQQTWAVQEEP